MGESDETMDRAELVRRAKARLSSVRERCNLDPTSDLFAARILELRTRRNLGLPVYDTEMVPEAVGVHDALAHARLAANRAVLSDE